MGFSEHPVPSLSTAPMAGIYTMIAPRSGSRADTIVEQDNNSLQNNFARVAEMPTYAHWLRI